MVYFISGHRDITPDEFHIHYAFPIKTTIGITGSDPIEFVVGDCKGVDSMAQDLLHSIIISNPSRKVKVTIYHMFAAPRYNAGFPCVGGFVNDHDRDSAMTMKSDHDIAWVRSGKESSGTAQNIIRRSIKNCFNHISKKEKKAILSSWASMFGITL